MPLPSLGEIRAAQELVYRYMPPTPQYTWPLVNARLGAEVWIKHENTTPVGAFKLRGGLVYLDDLRRTRPELAGVAAATRGNFGQGVAMAARLFGLKAAIVVPHGNSVEKNRAMRAQGAELIEEGHDFQAAFEFAQRLAETRGYAFVESFHELLVRGTATYALEFFQGAPSLDSIYVPIGLGSSICGVAAARNALGLRTEIVGVTAARAPAYARSFAVGQLIQAPAETEIADGLAVRRPNAQALEVIRAQVARIVEVGEEEIREAMRALYEDTHNVAEGAGAAAMAAAMKEMQALSGKRIGIVLTGGNVDRAVYAAVLSGAREGA
ncbi:MAG TPA: threonine dehydratase [Terracidiphilus sp.]|nr:threonine dehydratase [Terracidiphilus sp.]